MGNISNLKIETELGELVYKQVQDLNLSFSRIVDDFTDVANRFGDFSYEFNLPIVRQNSLVFGSPETKGSKKIFLKNRNIRCQVYNNNQLILDGLINLEGITKDTYRCKFYSKFKELVDTLNEETTDGDEKTLRDLNFPVVDDWDYETSIMKHIRANYLDSDETFYQYPVSFYSTYYCQESYYNGVNDDRGDAFGADRDHQNYYFMLNSVGADNNRMYHHQIPPAVYVTSIVEQILADAGWKLGGQFFYRSEVKKILYLYNGEDDIYDQATGVYSGHTTLGLKIQNFLPDMGQAEFLKGIINMFNLYFRIDVNNKILELETYDTYFRNTDDVDPYNINDLVDQGSFNNTTTYFLNNNPSITFTPNDNRGVFGNNQVMTGATDNATDQTWESVSSKLYNQVFNRVGFSENTNVNLNQYVSTVSNIELPFGEPNVKSHFIYNDYNINGSSQSATFQRMYLPILSKQNPSDNNGQKFNKKDTDTYLWNTEASIKFQGNGCLMYYYGIPTTDFENKSGKGSLADYMYFNMYTGATINRVPIPVVSPFQLMDYRDNVNDWLDGVTNANVSDRRTPVASYLQSVWQMMGTSSGVPSGKTTSFSLVFDDNGYFHDTLWSKFHKYKWDRYQNSEMFIADLRMNSYDWDQLQINRPILYKNELYSLVSLEGFNPITQRASIKMIKKL